MLGLLTTAQPGIGSDIGEAIALGLPLDVSGALACSMAEPGYGFVGATGICGGGQGSVMLHLPFRAYTAGHYPQ